MKHIRLLLLSFVSLLTLASCEDDSISADALQGHWVIVSNTKENALVLDFRDFEVDVRNSDWSYRPFTSDYTWSYYLDRDSVLHLSRYEGVDSDGYNEYDYLDFTISFSDSYQSLTLYYDPLIGSARTFKFMKRR